MLNGEKVTIFGDGEQTRDFINVNDVVQANIKAAESENINGAFNIASGTRISINQLIALISKNHSLITEHGPKRPGDVLHSLADISLAKQKLGFEPIVKLEEGIKEYIKWAQTTIG
jgi:nucleoside-diphosphate-sugar epimerase